MNENSELSKGEKKLIKIGIEIVVGIILVIILWPFGAIKAGNVGVVTRFGAINRVVDPGVYVKIPLVEHVNVMNTQTQKDQQTAQAASQDLQTVSSTIAVNYHLDGQHAPDVYQKIGVNYQDTVVTPAIQDTFKSVTAQYTAEQLITERENVRSSAQSELTAKLTPYYIIVDNFNIVNFDFSSDFDSAIEAKQVAQQNVETAKQQLAKAQVDAQTAVATAQGQADAQKALKDTGGLSPEYLEFLAISKWDGNMPTYWGGGAMPFVNVGK